MSENVVQPGIEPGSPDYRSDALTTRPLNQPRMFVVPLAPGGLPVSYTWRIYFTCVF